MQTGLVPNRLRTKRIDYLYNIQKVSIDILSGKWPECLCKLDPKFQLSFHCYDKEEVGQEDRSVFDGTPCAFSCEKLARKAHCWCTPANCFPLGSFRSYNLIRSGRVKLAVSRDRVNDIRRREENMKRQEGVLTERSCGKSWSWHEWMIDSMPMLR